MAVHELGSIRPSLGRDVFVADSAAVIGDVHLGDEASVWFGAILRGDYLPIRVGARTNIQDNAVLHITSGKAATFVGDDVTIGHAAILHGCTVGNFCLIGMASVVLDGAVIGDESLLAAGSLVAPGTKIPRRSFALGRPAKVTRSLGDADLAAIRETAQNYVAFARDFRTRCRKIELP